MQARLVPLLLTACAAPPPSSDLASLFHESLHGFVMGPPYLRLEEDALRGARYDDANERLLITPGGSFTSGWIRGAAPFDEVLASWNVRVPAGAGLTVEVQVRGDAGASPWLYLGDWGVAPPLADRTVSFDGGEVAVDVLRLTAPCAGARLRLAAVGEAEAPVEVYRTTLCLTDRRRLTDLDPAPATGPVSIDVPARSQRVEEASLAPRICSPTSVAMVLEAQGVVLPTADVAARIYDVDHDIYGNWPRAVQAAFDLGVPGALVRLSSWRAVEHFLQAGVPLIVSVKAEEGDLRGAPYPRTSGHLLVLRGLTADGRVLVNDPAAAPPGVPRSYHQEDMERCWMRRGGVAYAIGQ
jgi:hypothetical protein